MVETQEERMGREWEKAGYTGSKSVNNCILLVVFPEILAKTPSSGLHYNIPPSMLVYYWQWHPCKM